MNALKARWALLAPREKLLVAAAAALVAVALLWWVAVAPALGTLRAAPARHAALDAQLQRMQSLQAEAQRAPSRVSCVHSEGCGCAQFTFANKVSGSSSVSRRAWKRPGCSFIAWPVAGTSWMRTSWSSTPRSSAGTAAITSS